MLFLVPLPSLAQALASHSVGRQESLEVAADPGESGATVYCTGRSTRQNRLPRGGAV
jgi:hypothetical protein